MGPGVRRDDPWKDRAIGDRPALESKGKGYSPSLISLYAIALHPTARGQVARWREFWYLTPRKLKGLQADAKDQDQNP
jgi:hypothetical protein